MDSDRIKVLYIAGWGRSGSTILASVLGSVDGFFSAGELSFVWRMWLEREFLCGCRTPFEECEVWSTVRDRALPDADDAFLNEMIRYRRKARTAATQLRLLTPGLASAARAEFKPYTDRLEALLSGLRDTAGCDVIVDSSKYLAEALLLETIPSVDLRVVHIVRDPRAVAHSWRRRKTLPETGKPMGTHSPLSSSRGWLFRNVLTAARFSRRPGRYLRLRYEDFILNPIEWTARIVALTGEERGDLPFVSDREVNLAVDHSVAGNPSRYNRGVVKLSLDDAWKAEMSRKDRAMVTAVTWPLLLGYRYGVR